MDVDNAIAAPALSTTPATRPVARGRSGPAAGFWLSIAAFAVVMVAGSIPTPLYVLYQARDHFGTGMLTIAFALYAVGVLTSLLVGGHLSDHLGRRPLILTAIGIQLVSCAVFLSSSALPALLAGRLLSGLSIGLLTGAATAHAGELHAAARPTAPARRAERTAAAANLGGIAVGPLLAGILAQYAPIPLRLPYMVMSGLLLLAGVAIFAAPETRAPAESPTYRPQGLALPEQRRGRFLAAAFGALVAFALLGLFSAMAPSFLAGTLHQRSHALAGLVAFAALGAAAGAQLLLPPRIRSNRALALASTAVPIGLGLLVAGVYLPSLAVFIAGGVMTGAGAGVLFKGCLGVAIQLAPAQRRAGILSSLFTAAYVGLAVPVIVLGIASQHIDPRVALAAFATAVLVALACSAIALFSTAAATDH